MVTAGMSVCVFVKLPVSMEEVMDLLNEVSQQLEDVGEMCEDQVDYPVTSSPGQPAEGHVRFSTPSPSKSATSPSKRSVFSPKTPPHWVEDQKSLLQILCQQVEALKVSPTPTAAEESITFFAFALAPCEFTF
ncbi:RANBP2-like and GRIP domain-containing protein 5/6 [Sinocyclocheilus grahami]|uniref:RANBP2-like and GRIP domain-containing protein 5/6 n=1 Tax=Sinocyclocheilus grahami TaxID=75366 RepID=UPI0007AD3550|nr:PREDICTED: RANBP2-like and GRIP domain-containing protein 5/6 [Sinocyclocheilus grahami]